MGTGSHSILRHGFTQFGICLYTIVTAEKIKVTKKARFWSFILGGLECYEKGCMVKWIGRQSMQLPFVP